jgi:hypothetical protein
LLKPLLGTLRHLRLPRQRRVPPLQTLHLRLYLLGLLELTTQPTYTAPATTSQKTSYTHI